MVDESQTAKYAREYVHGHIIIDTEANPSNTDFRQVAEGCDLLVIPAVPETTATDGLTYTLAKLYEIGNDRYRVLLTKVPPKPRTDGAQLRAMLVQNNIPVFTAEIPNLVAFDKALAEGVPVYAVDDIRAKRAWEAYRIGRKGNCSWLTNQNTVLSPPFEKRSSMYPKCLRPHRTTPAGEAPKTAGEAQ